MTKVEDAARVLRHYLILAGKGEPNGLTFLARDPDANAELVAVVENIVAAAVEQMKAVPPNMLDMAENLWNVVANVSGGDWSVQSAEWQIAAAKARDAYLAALRIGGSR